ncbi:MAG: PLDc N-terminal domain-containing protein [Methanomicrobiales archaeon]
MMFGPVGIPFNLFLFLLLGLIATIFWIWMLVDCVTREPDTGSTRLIWVIIIIFTSVLGALLYCIIRRPERIREESVSMKATGGN